MARVSGQLPTLAKVGVNGQSCAGRVGATFDGKDSSMELPRATALKDLVRGGR
jgi:hypothetical protein